ncbi:hypothetical protein B0H15DRAFT_532588 [Mycena belliarum]|uniref:Protein SMG7 n=1 Tax=Mycena belliarum TaxID=1033014 RepID=A0AAD6TYF7_9AGAR|nr:hypothetical protein B0H15DRAFT_532588 [Mycena belliae]
MQTSYAFITLYKQRLARPSNSNANGGPVEARKLLQRFRQFLAEEERFWRALVRRVQRAYKIVLPRTVALPAELVGGVDDAEDAPGERTNHFGFPSARGTTAGPGDLPDGGNIDGGGDGAEGAAEGKDEDNAIVDTALAHSVLSKTFVCLGDIARYREQYKVSPAAAKGGAANPHAARANYARPRALYLAAHALAPHEGNAAHQLAILAGYDSDPLAALAWYLRALCVPAPFETAEQNLAGVLARAAGSFRAGKGGSSAGKNGAQERGLSGVEKDARAEIWTWATAAGEEVDEEKEREAEEALPPRVRIERFKRDVVLLHALWREGSTPPRQTLALSSYIARAFARLVAARALPEELIVRIGVLAQGAVWVGRMLAPPTSAPAVVAATPDRDKGRRRNRNKSAPAAITPPVAKRPLPALQAAHLAHLLALYTALLGVGVRELADAGTGVGVRGPLAERISAELRRTLPALRVGSKWTLGNWAWVRAVGEKEAREATTKGQGEIVEIEDEEQELRAQLGRLWATYAEFLRRLARTFPIATLPPLSEAEDDGKGAAVVQLELELEEDLDMRGWLPLRGFMGGPCPSSEDQAQNSGQERRTVGLREEVHPNVEQLMRIADLLRDGQRIVALEDSPLTLYGGQFVVKSIEALVPAAGPIPSVLPRAAADALASIRGSRLAMDIEDDAMTEQTEQTSHTADDILHDAFSFLNQAQEGSEGGVADDSDEDEIVWDLREAPVSPLPATATARTSPKTPMRPTPIGPPSRTPLEPASVPLPPFRLPPAQLQPSQPIAPGTHVPATTALDLLNNFTKAPLAKPLHVATTQGAGAGGVSLLPGSRAVPSQSIWSASRDEQGLMFSGGGGAQHAHPHPYQEPQQHYHSQPAPQEYAGGGMHHQRFPSQEQSTIWASSYPAPGPQEDRLHVVPHQHERVVSNAMAAAQLFPSGGDQYGYGPMLRQYPVGMTAGGGGAQEELGVFYSTAPISPVAHLRGFMSQHPQSSHGQIHARHLSLHDPRGGAFHGPPVAPVSQMWGRAG